MFGIRPWVIRALSLATLAIIALRAVEAISALGRSETTAFLAFPLAVLIPALALLFLATRRDMRSQEGALMQLGTMIQLLLIIALPRFALYLALGFPVVFLVVELFETRCPLPLRNWIKAQVLRC